MPFDTGKEPNLEKIRELLLGSELPQLPGRVANLEQKIAAMDQAQVLGQLKEIEALRNDINAAKSDIQEIKDVLVGLNRKLTSAFSAFTDFVRPSK